MQKSLLLFILVIFFITLTLYKNTRIFPSLSKAKYTSEEIVNFIDSPENTCVKENNYNKCQNDISLRLLEKFSFEDLLIAFKLSQEKDPSNSCHDVMHYIASNEYKGRKDLPEVFNTCTSVCFNACYHGAVLGYLQDSGLAGLDDEAIAETITHACDSILNSEKQVQIGNCIHGIGHALMLVTNNELPISLKLCNSFNNLVERETCYGGVFMENFPNSSSSDHPSKYIKADDPMYPCNILEEKYLEPCYIFLSDYFTYLTNNDLDKRIALCGQVPLPYRNNCYRTIGSGALGRVQDINKVEAVCDNIPVGEAKENCVQGIVISFADRFGGDNEKFLKMFDFCKVVYPQYKQPCYTQIGTNLQQWLPNEKTDLCNKLANDDERKWCVGNN